MHPEKGAWFTAKLVIEKNGNYKVDFDYDTEPDFVPQLTADAYALDFQYYPRDEEHIPDWLRDKLNEARDQVRSTSASSWNAGMKRSVMTSRVGG